MTHLMVPNPFIRLDAARSTMRGIGQVLQRRRWAYLAQQSPVFLRPLEQRYDPLVVDRPRRGSCLASRREKTGQIGQRLLPLVLIIILSLLIVTLFGASVGFAQGWTSYSNARYGASADVPPGFVPAGPEAKNSDGLIFRSHKGGYLVIYGADVPGRRFEAFMAKMMANEKSYNGWPIAGSKITPSWAEYWGAKGGSQLRVKVLASCKGRQAVVTKFVFSRNMLRDVERVERSLKAGPARSC